MQRVILVQLNLIVHKSGIHSCSFIHPFIHAYIHLFIHSFIYLFIHLSILTTKQTLNVFLVLVQMYSLFWQFIIIQDTWYTIILFTSDHITCLSN